MMTTSSQIFTNSYMIAYYSDLFSDILIKIVYTTMVFLPQMEQCKILVQYTT